MKRRAGIKTKAKAKTKRAAKKKAAPVKSRAAKTAKATKPAMPGAAVPDTLDTLVSTGTAAMKLPLDPSWHAGVKFNLGLIMRMGAVVDEFPLPDDAEPGPVFYA
jgi:hypothetical protein